jgi:membrane protease YdiL (CAAX protease family)
LVPGAVANLVVQSLPLESSDTGAFAVLLPIVMPLWAAINEEIGMRGILQGRLQRYMPAWLAIGITTCVFVWLHHGTSWFYAEVPFYIALSLTSGFIAARSRSVLPSMSLHLTVNMLGIMLPLIAGTVRLREMPYSLAIALLISAGISLYLYRRVVRSIRRKPQPVNEVTAAVATDDQPQSGVS